MKILCAGLVFFQICDVPDPPKPTSVVCPPLIEWASPDQKAAATALKGLPSGHPLRTMAQVTVKQRDLIRRCAVAKGGM